MAIYDYLPTYNYIEPNNLKGLLPGFVVAQCDNVDSTLLVNGMMENGTICSIDVDSTGEMKIVAPAATGPLFICYSDPLLTMVQEDKFFAVKVSEECPRLVQLIPGDEWMGTKALSGIAGIKEVTKGDDFLACTTMANGDAGHHYVFVGR